jgi:hypothetical protein
VSASAGQLDLDGGEQADPRIDKAARALYLQAVRRRHQCDEETAKVIARQTWPRVQKHYEADVRLVLAVGGFQ